MVTGILAGRAELPEISDWKRECWFLPRTAAERLHISMPESRFKAAPQLMAHLGAARLVQVEEAEALKAIKAGEQALFLTYHRVGGGGGMDLHNQGTVQGFSCEDGGLFAQAFGTGEEEEDEDYGQDHDTAAVYDRILSALSGGALSLYDVDLALLARSIQDAEIASWEAEIQWVAEQAHRHQAEATEILDRLREAPGDRIQLPGGSEAIRQRQPAFTLQATEDVQLTGLPIVVPAAERWWVEDVAAFNPPPRLERRERALARLRAAPAARANAGWILGVAVLVVLGALWLWLR